MILSYDKFSDIFKSNNFKIDEKKYNDFKRYAELLVEWNEKVNLTAITDPEGISIKHFLDSLFIFKYAEVKDNSSIVDVGTGAGFPGIPMKIYNNTLDVTLLDSLNKRINFLKAVSEDISLSMECVHARAEDGGRNEDLRERFDIATARAVSNLPVLCEYCMPFVKVGGRFIALKGPNANDEISQSKRAISILGGKLESTVEYELPNGDKRTIVIIKKISHTPTKYPRNSGQIIKKSL